MKTLVVSSKRCKALLISNYFCRYWDGLRNKWTNIFFSLIIITTQFAVRLLTSSYRSVDINIVGEHDYRKVADLCFLLISDSFSKYSCYISENMTHPEGVVTGSSFSNHQGCRQVCLQLVN